uniref:Plastid light harvesting protein n=1 Tax=Octactis speculum TaxID=3111310 RepID=A0A6U3TIK4_9STRA|mmetsp:Transcript_38175/g.51652  ORF Transcript_38175/g.51652 Transcript_38175/m.51652 type:complete len:219 (+) Transcript_38175:71-727(+)
MMARNLILSLALFCGIASAFVPANVARVSTRADVSIYPDIPEDRVMEGAMPPVGYFDPWGLADMGTPETLAWFRAAELKHGRVCMAAVTGWLVNAAGIYLPGNIDYSGHSFASLGNDPMAAWAAVPDGGKAQMIAAIGFLEFHSELAKPHVMRGGVPGKINTMITPGLWDPVGFTKGMPEAQKAVQRTKELANGRLAMIAMMSFICADKIPGSVPFIP